MQPFTSEEELAIFPEKVILSGQHFNYLEGNIDEQGGVRFQRKRLQSTELALDFKQQVASEIGQTANCIKVLSIPRLKFPRELPKKRLRLGLTKAVLVNVIECWKLHPYTLEAMVYNNGIFADFSSQSEYWITLKVPNSMSIGYDFVSVYHNWKSNTTNVLYHALGDEDVVLNTIERYSKRCLNPLFFVATLYRHYQNAYETYRLAIDERILKIEEQIGYGRPRAWLNPKLDGESKELDNKRLIKLLSHLHTDSNMLSCTAKFGSELGDWTSQRLIRLCQSVCENSADTDSEHRALRTSVVAFSSTANRSAEILEEVEYIRRRFISASSQIQVLQGRVYNLNTLIHGLIAQKESENARVIALDSKRDSASMKTIAILTTLFLPSTFVATFFSTNLIEWNNAQGSSPRVSEYLWVYWVISISLTIVVMGGWITWSRKQHSNWKLELGNSHV